MVWRGIFLGPEWISKPSSSEMKVFDRFGERIFFLSIVVFLYTVAVMDYRALNSNFDLKLKFPTNSVLRNSAWKRACFAFKMSETLREVDFAVFFCKDCLKKKIYGIAIGTKINWEKGLGPWNYVTYIAWKIKDDDLVLTIRKYISDNKVTQVIKKKTNICDQVQK